MDTSGTARATAAAISIATSLGLSADDAVVLHNSNKLALRLTPGDVVARVAPIGEEVAQFELDLVRQLAAAGCPVGALEPRVDPEVYRSDGFAMTFWTYYEQAGSYVQPHDYADALHRLHAGMRPLTTASPRFTDRVDEAAAIIADPDRSPRLAAADRAFLAGRLADLRAAIEARHGPEQLLHGEPHPGNVLSTSDGPRFIDWETCCRGPVEFDLAHVPAPVCEHYPGIDHELLDECRQLVIAMVGAWRWDRADQFPDGQRYGEEFLRLLRAGPPWPTLDEVIA